MSSSWGTGTLASSGARRVIIAVLLIGFTLTAYQTFFRNHLNLLSPSKPSQPDEDVPKAEVPDPEPPHEDTPVGAHFHITAVEPTLPSQAIPNCQYPVILLVSPDKHCSGALALYSSIVRNVILQPDNLRNKTCVHVMYVEETMTSIEDMYRWRVMPNPYTTIEDCSTLSSPALQAVVPLQFHPIPHAEIPSFLNGGLPANWKVAFDKVQLWGFDLYPRVLLMDVDTILITDLHLVFEETDPWTTVAIAPDQFANCMDRARANSGFIVLRASRYFHVVALETLHNRDASCLTGDWGQGDQELIGCMCGFGYLERPLSKGIRREFRCEIMPMWNNVWPLNYKCSDANMRPMRSLHFTACSKPWDIAEEKLGDRVDTVFWACCRDAGRKEDVDGLSKCGSPDEKDMRLLDNI